MIVEETKQEWVIRIPKKRLEGVKSERDESLGGRAPMSLEEYLDRILDRDERDGVVRPVKRK